MKINKEEENLDILLDKSNYTQKSFLDKTINNQQSNRNYGIDLLKIIAMINIINLHINLFIIKLTVSTPNFKQIYFLEVFSYWPINAFGFISGIISFKKSKFNNVIYIWFESFFHSIIFSLYLFYKSEIGLKKFILSFFPLGITRHWYVNAYILMYLFLPFILKSINSINKDSFTKIIICYFFIYSIYHIIIELNVGMTNYAFINKGNSSLWLLILFIIGGYIGRFYINKSIISKSVFIMIYFLSSLITYVCLFYNFENDKKPNGLLMQTHSPTTVLQALSLIFFFANIKITQKYIIKVILFFNPLNFNITLIHLRFFGTNLKTKRKLFAYIRALNPKFIFFKIYGISILIYIICAFIDYIRYIIFKSLKVRNFSNYIAKKINIF